ncbi:hypothetical protein C8J56DRAFT_279331 [Mycena floridula]|nr:hypothetical protein C8J56DRAFT_279331 [Mycena floridula]
MSQFQGSYITTRMSEMEVASALVLFSLSQRNIRKTLCPSSSSFDMRNIPRDVLQEIFIHCLPSGRTTTRMTRRDAPILLGQICRSWRQVSLGTTQLWSSLCLDLCIYSTPKEKLRMENANAWISRSGSQPLDIHINCTLQDGSHLSPLPNSMEFPPQAKSQPFVTNFIRSVLQPQSHRWQHFSVRGPAYWLMSLPRLAASEVPLLKSFHHTAIQGRPATSFWRSLDLLGAKSLQELELVFKDQCFFIYDPKQDLRRAISVFPLSKLTKLRLEGWACSLSEASNLLSLCTSLESCSIQTEILGPETEMDLRPLSMPHLFSFTLHEQHPTDVAKPFFEMLDAPRLQYLDYCCWSEVCQPWILLSTPIQNLTLHVFDISFDPVHDFLQSNNSIRKLRVWRPAHGRRYGPLFDYAFIARLMPRSKLGILCPRLESLEMLNCVAAPEDLSFYALLKARSKFQSDDGIVHFKQARISFDIPVNPEVFEQFEPLVSAGLTVEIEYKMVWESTQTVWPKKSGCFVSVG